MVFLVRATSRSQIRVIRGRYLNFLAFQLVHGLIICQVFVTRCSVGLGSIVRCELRVLLNVGCVSRRAFRVIVVGNASGHVV